MKILVLGLGFNGGGRAAAEYFIMKKHKVRISDISPRESFGSLVTELESKGIECFFSDKDPRANILWADVVIKNPAIPTNLPQLYLAKRIATDFSYLFTSDYKDKVKFIVVTGTKGKTTTVSAITHAVNAMGKEALYCGNIGISAFTILNELDRRSLKNEKLPDFIICELSSWQIHDAYIALNGMMPKFTLAIFTSIYADHQNRYSSMKEYKEDKMKLFGEHCEKILLREDVKEFFLEQAPWLKKRVSTFPSLTNPYKAHKMELACAFDAMKLTGCKRKDIIKALSSYRGMPHRGEQIAIKNDIMYINDSAATISEAVTFSMKNIAPLSVHLICGGTDKELLPSGMEMAVKKATSITLLDGSFTRNKLIPLLDEKLIAFDGPYSNMHDAFIKANSKAVEKQKDTDRMQVVLLSPGASSFELFRNEFDRGNQFREEVLRLLNGEDKT